MRWYYPYKCSGRGTAPLPSVNPVTTSPMVGISSRVTVRYRKEAGTDFYPYRPSSGTRVSPVHSSDGL